MVLDSELLSRGKLSDTEVLAITLRDFTSRDVNVKRGDRWFAGRRIEAFLRTAGERNELPAYATALEEIIRLAPATAPGEADNQIIGPTLRAMQAAGMNSIDPAIELIKQRRSVRDALWHLSQSPPSEDLIAKLSRVAVPLDLQSEQERIIANLKRKLAN
jgi:hypothetical protein